MKQAFDKRFVLVPIGILIVSGALASWVTLHTSDPVTGTVMGIGIGLAALPFIANKIKVSR